MSTGAESLGRTAAGGLAGRAAAAVEKGVAFLDRRQLADGAFRTFTWIAPDFDSRVEDHCIFPTAIMAQALSAAPLADPARGRALGFLASQADRRGLWRHWPRGHRLAKYPCQDLDDTACASEALRRGGRPVPDNRGRILANRDREGRFLSWVITLERRLFQPFTHRHFLTVTPSRKGDVDAVVNANTIFYLGYGPDTERAAAWLVALLREGRELAADKWYEDPFVIWYFFARALAGQDSEARTLLLERLRSTRPANALHQALAITVLIECGAAVDEARVSDLLDAQLPSGAWPIAPFYKAARTQWGSDEMTTAFAVEALARFAGAKAG